MDLLSYKPTSEEMGMVPQAVPSPPSTKYLVHKNRHAIAWHETCCEYYANLLEKIDDDGKLIPPEVDHDKLSHHHRHLEKNYAHHYDRLTKLLSGQTL